MSKTDKLLIKLENASNSFTWSDLAALLKTLGFEQIEGSGSRVRFMKGDLQIRLHKPHPQKELKAYAVKQIREILKSEGLL
ncbi:MAG TPA: type II toxin-antitoxin system HicA family toxin [Gammaproteobacteria bacterium]|nr:type II toxin-antitoxin system HicA family toxin [Gammaproteobacteria bacterium]